EHAALLGFGRAGLGFAGETLRRRRPADRRGQGEIPLAVEVPRRDRRREPDHRVERQDVQDQPRDFQPWPARGRGLRGPSLGRAACGGAGAPESGADTAGDQVRVRLAMPKQIISSQAAPTTGFTDKGTPSPLAQAIRAGNLLFVSGQGPLDPKTREVVSPDIREQTKQTLSNLKSVLAAAGLDFTHVVNMRVVLRNTEDFAAFNETFRELM